MTTNLLISEFKVNRLYKYVGAHQHAVYKNVPGARGTDAGELEPLQFGDIVLCVEEPKQDVRGNSDRYGPYTSYMCHVLRKDMSVWVYHNCFERAVYGTRGTHGWVLVE